MKTIDEKTRDTLDAIEALLVAERTSVRDAIDSAYKLGVMDGMLKMAKRGEEDLAPVIKKVLEVMEVFKPDA